MNGSVNRERYLYLSTLDAQPRKKHWSTGKGAGWPMCVSWLANGSFMLKPFLETVFGIPFFGKGLFFKNVLGNVFGNHVWLMHFWRTFLEKHVWKKNILGNRFWETSSVPSTTNGTKRKQRNRNGTKSTLAPSDLAGA